MKKIFKAILTGLLYIIAGIIFMAFYIGSIFALALLTGFGPS